MRVANRDVLANRRRRRLGKTMIAMIVGARCPRPGGPPIPLRPLIGVSQARVRPGMFARKLHAMARHRLGRQNYYLRFTRDSPWLSMGDIAAWTDREALAAR